MFGVLLSLCAIQMLETNGDKAEFSRIQGLAKVWYFKFGSILLHVPDVHVGAQRAVDKREYFVIIRDNFCQFLIKT